jgi:hypothetical protein
LPPHLHRFRPLIQAASRCMTCTGRGAASARPGRHQVRAANMPVPSTAYEQRPALRGPRRRVRRCLLTYEAC